MLREICIILFGVSLIAAGCASDEQVPKIVSKRTYENPVSLDYSSIDEGTNRSDATLNVPESWIPPSSLERDWQAIVIHHSATESGNAAIFDRWHREHHNWDGVGYDFVIGNGSDSGNGRIEVTFRWREQRTGAHCKTPGNWANEKAVGICLVGNFDYQRPTTKQIQSLLRLVRFLRNRYGIPKSRIYGHKTTPGARVTSCPGENFPMARIKSML